MLFDYSFMIIYLMMLEHRRKVLNILLEHCSTDSDFEELEETESSVVSEESGLNSCKLRQLQKDLETPNIRRVSKDPSGRQIQPGTAKAKAVPRVLAWVNDQRRRKAMQPHNKQPEKNQSARILPQTVGPQAGQAKLGDVQVPNASTSSTFNAKQPLQSSPLEQRQQRAHLLKSKSREVPEDWEPRRSKRMRIATDQAQVVGVDLRNEKRDDGVEHVVGTPAGIEVCLG